MAQGGFVKGADGAEGFAVAAASLLGRHGGVEAMMGACSGLFRGRWKLSLELWMWGSDVVRARGCLYSLRGPVGWVRHFHDGKNHFNVWV